MAGPVCKEESRLYPDASFGVGFYCFALHWFTVTVLGDSLLSPSMLFSDDPVKNRSYFG